MNSCTFGLSCVAPRCRWHPKNRSSGSWQILWLRNDLTSSIANRSLTNPTNDLPVNINVTHYAFDLFTYLLVNINVTHYAFDLFTYLLVIFNPNRVEWLNNMFPCSVFVKPFRALALLSHSARYGRKSFSSHCTIANLTCACYNFTHIQNLTCKRKSLA